MEVLEHILISQEKGWSFELDEIYQWSKMTCDVSLLNMVGVFILIHGWFVLKFEL